MDLFGGMGLVPSRVTPPTSPTAKPAAAPVTPEVVYVRNLRAKHYRLTLRRDGTPVATIPARGSEREARRFVREHQDWLDRTLARHRSRPRMADRWLVGTRIMWRGEMTEIRTAVRGERPQVCLAADVFRVADLTADLRPTLESAFKSRARVELTSRTWELAAETDMDIKKVSVRSQRTRWGSCTEGGVISLNWRLILAPAEVSDYVIYHELMHLREMNHSRRFWRAVKEVCPDYESAEAWLDEHGPLVGL